MDSVLHRFLPPPPSHWQSPGLRIDVVLQVRYLCRIDVVEDARLLTIVGPHIFVWWLLPERGLVAVRQCADDEPLEKRRQ